jgi:hypothetical protein
MEDSMLKQMLSGPITAPCAGLLCCLLPGNAFAAGTETSASGTAAANAAALDEWRKAMAQIPVPNRTSCFKGTYPNKAWQEIPCNTAPDRPYLPDKERVPGPAYVGGRYRDAVAQVAEYAQRYYSVTGSFDSGSTATGETGTAGTGCPAGTNPTGANIFSLQLNTNTFLIPTSSNICGGVAGCTGFQQFVYSSYDNAAFIQYWLINAGACPTGGGWTQRGNDCYKSTPAVGPGPNNPLTIADLPNLILTGTAAENGDDTVVLAIAAEVYQLPPQPDSILGLAPMWQDAEFNVFGDACGAQAQFGAGTVLNVRLVVNANPGFSPTTAPVCTKFSYSDETNNLSFTGPAQAFAPGLGPALVFTEASGATGAPSCAAQSSSSPPPGSAGGASDQCMRTGIVVPCITCDFLNLPSPRTCGPCSPRGCLAQ